MSSGILPMPDSCAGITEAEHWSAPVLLFISIFFGRATTDRAGARPLSPRLGRVKPERRLGQSIALPSRALPP
jgi:hypothetical protein